MVVDDETWVAEQVAHGAPELMARFTLGTFQAAREGRFAGVDPLLGELIGREPRTVRDLLAERVAGWLAAAAAGSHWRRRWPCPGAAG